MREVYNIQFYIGAVSYIAVLNEKGGKYFLTIGRIKDPSVKKFKSEEIHSSEYFFKPQRIQIRNAGLLIAEPDAKKHQPEEEEKTEVASEEKSRKPLVQ